MTTEIQDKLEQEPKLLGLIESFFHDDHKEQWKAEIKERLAVKSATSALRENDLCDAWKRAIAQLNDAFMAVYDAYSEGPNSGLDGAIVCVLAADDLFERYVDRYEFDLNDLAYLAQTIVHRYCESDEYWNTVIDYMKYHRTEWHAKALLEKAREHEAKAMA